MRKIDTGPVLAAGVRADLRRSRTPKQIAGPLRLEAGDISVSLVKISIADGAMASLGAIYQWIYATLPASLPLKASCCARPGRAAGCSLRAPAAGSSAWFPSTTDPTR